MAEDPITLLSCFDIETLARQERDLAASLEWKPLYPVEMDAMPYPSDYEVPMFQKCDSRKGNTREHVVCFLDSMVSCAHNTNLYLKEFSKSLSDRAHTCYINLKPRTVCNWAHLVSHFNSKLFYVEAKFSLIELFHARQYSNKGLGVYLIRFHKKALDCCDSLDEELVVNVCSHGMAEEYRIFLENLSFSSFSKLMNAG